MKLHSLILPSRRLLVAGSVRRIISGLDLREPLNAGGVNFGDPVLELGGLDVFLNLAIFQSAFEGDELPLLEGLGELGYWGATEQKTRLRIQLASIIEPDGLRSGRNWGMATIRDRLGHVTATQRFGSIQYSSGTIVWPLQVIFRALSAA
jgi:hypothetical protein